MQDKFRLMMDSKAKTREEIAQELKRMIELKARPVEDPQASPTDSGESTPDISAAVRKSVQDRISSIVREAIQSAGEESYGEKIPPRETLREPGNSVDYLSGSDTLSADDLAFAPSETDADTAEGSIRAKIEGMRRLGQRFYNGYMLRPCAEETLVQQGEYVMDVTDDFGRNCFCGIERPVYGALSTDQLRTYFTWRTLARNGVYNRTDKPYIILYCYELLNRIGVLSAADAYNRLSGVWEGCREFCPALDKLLPRWLKDFRAYNDMAAASCPPRRRISGRISAATQWISWNRGIPGSWSSSCSVPPTTSGEHILHPGAPGQCLRAPWRRLSPPWTAISPPGG